MHETRVVLEVRKFDSLGTHTTRHRSVCQTRSHGMQRDGLTAGPRPLCTPLMPSFRHVFAMTSSAFLYTLVPPCFASSPCSCMRVFATSAGFDTVTYTVSWRVASVCTIRGLTATHAANPPHRKPSALDNGRVPGAGALILQLQAGTRRALGEG